MSFTGKTEFEADTYFPMLGVNLAVLEPGEPNSMYHWETEAFVISGEALDEADANVPESQPSRYRDGWLPD